MIGNNHNSIGLLRGILRKVKHYTDTVVYFVLSLIPVSKKKKSIALVRMDGIGDYVLFRNFLSCFKNDKTFKEYTIYFIGNKLWKDLSLFLDGSSYHYSIWINKSQFLRNPFYRYYMFLRLHFVSVDVAVNSAYSRDFVDDAVISAVYAKKKIGYQGDDANMDPSSLSHGSQAYSQFITPRPGLPIFEFYRNKDFFDQLLDRTLTLERPSISFAEGDKRSPSPGDSAKYVVIFPGGGHGFKIWKYAFYAHIIAHILSTYDYHVYLAGSKQDAKHAAAILRHFETPDARVVDVCGCLSLVDLLHLLSQASLYLGSDTGAAHITACCGVPVIAFFNGQHFGRFAPYPENFHYKFFSLYPPALDISVEQFQKNTQRYRYSSPYAIQDIQPKTVIRCIDTVLKNYA